MKKICLIFMLFFVFSTGTLNATQNSKTSYENKFHIDVNLDIKEPVGVVLVFSESYYETEYQSFLNRDVKSFA